MRVIVNAMKGTLHTEDGITVQYLLDGPEEKAKGVVLFVPGVSGKALTDEYKLLADRCAESGLMLMRLQIWDSPEDLGRMTVRQICNAISGAAATVCAQEKIPIYAVGKSFGGAMVLCCNNELIQRMVLWAPAIGVRDAGSTLPELENMPLSQIENSMDIALDKERLEQIQTPTLLIQGTNDNVVPVVNSQKLVSCMPQGEIQLVTMAHSPKSEEEMSELCNLTLEFLLKDI